MMRNAVCMFLQGSYFTDENIIKMLMCVDESRATCRNCDGDDCTNNILEDVIEEEILTSGYFGVVPLASTKPPGKRFIPAQMPQRYTFIIIMDNISLCAVMGLCLCHLINNLFALL